MLIIRAHALQNGDVVYGPLKQKSPRGFIRGGFQNPLLLQFSGIVLSLDYCNVNFNTDDMSRMLKLKGFVGDATSRSQHVM